MHVFRLGVEMMRLEHQRHAIERKEDKEHLGILPCKASEYDAYLAAQDELFNVPGVADLRLLCQAEGVEFNCAWLNQQQAKLQLDHGLSHRKVYTMAVEQFAATVAKFPANRKPTGRPRGATMKKTRDIKSALASGEHPDDVATRFKVTPNYVNKIRRGLKPKGALISSKKGRETRR